MSDHPPSDPAWEATARRYAHERDEAAGELAALRATLHGVLGFRPSVVPTDAEIIAEAKDVSKRADDAEIALAEAHAALDLMPASSAPDCDTPSQRIRYATAAWLDERREASNLAQLCQEAHDALTAAGAPTGWKPADRIRHLTAERDALHAALDAAGAPHASTAQRLLTVAERVGCLAEQFDALRAELAAYRSRGLPPKATEPATGNAAAIVELLDHMHEAAEDNDPVSPRVVNALRSLLGVPS